METFKTALFGLWFVVAAAFFLVGWLMVMGSEFGPLGIIALVIFLAVVGWRRLDRDYDGS